MGNQRQIAPLFAALATEFRDALVTWEEVVPFSTGSSNQAIRLDLYVWPMIVIERGSSGLVLQRLSWQGAGS